MLSQNGFDKTKIELYPLKARYETGIAVFDPDRQEIVDVLRHPEFSSIERNRVAIGNDG